MQDALPRPSDAGAASFKSFSQFLCSFFDVQSSLGCYVSKPVYMDIHMDMTATVRLLGSVILLDIHAIRSCLGLDIHFRCGYSLLSAYFPPAGHGS